ncbi:MAG: GntR family transcriptional regulator [Maritimibacter sp.]|uniref:GntR family transcriptional regulator n=1 Tax=Psychromarinibacter halotolerans TaxID=1775175 RepID=A0ABV7GNI3_9RHOB|nr:GntR family transcriptional regulator [Maritimibacter sp.]
MDSAASFKPVRARQTVQDQIYDQLRTALVNGAFEAGESFTISAMADRFMTSHMPVREALRRLAAENALRISSTGTAVVPDLDTGELAQITQARMIIEPATAGIAFDRISSDVRASLEKILAQHQTCGETGDVVTMLECNRHFHFGIYRAAGNDVLVSQIENLWLRSGAYVRFLSDRMGELLQTSYKNGFAMYHEVMLKALDDGDRDAFVRTMAEDIEATHRLLTDFLKED